MFYDSIKNKHGLPNDPFKALISPRPIGWIGTIGKDGSKNLAPYSFFNAMADSPKLVMFGSGGYKDSVRNCEESGVFSVNMVGFSHIQAMSDSSAPLPYGENEFQFSGIQSEKCRLIDAPYVVGAFSVLECKVTDICKPNTLNGPHETALVVTGQVVGIHIQDEIVIDGKVDVTKVRPASRLGYFDYAVVDEVFEIKRPKMK